MINEINNKKIKNKNHLFYLMALLLAPFVGQKNCPRPTYGKTAHTLDLMQSCMCLK